MRKVQDDDAQNPRCIETVPKRGYSFIAELKCGETKEEKVESFELIDNFAPPSNDKSFSTKLLVDEADIVLVMTQVFDLHFAVHTIAVTNRLPALMKSTPQYNVSRHRIDDEFKKSMSVYSKPTVRGACFIPSNIQKAIA